MKRFVEFFLRPWDNEDNEIVLRWRIFTQNWLPYRTAEFLGVTEDGTDMILGPWKWHPPRKFRRRSA